VHATHRKAHDELEELFAVGFGFRDCNRLEAFKVPSDSILLFHRKAYGDESFQKIDSIDTCNEAFVLIFSKDARNDD